MQCKDLEQVIEERGLTQLSEAAQAHAAGCPSCAALVEDFSAILIAAKQIPAEVEPPARVWVALEAQLEAEGVIRQPKATTLGETPAWWKSFGMLIRGRMLVTAGVAALILIAGVYQIRYRSVERPIPTNVVSVPEPYAETGTTLDQEEQSLGPVQTVGTRSSGVSNNVDVSLRENLATVNAFIKECRKRLQEDPNDPMAREYLSTAYQQKAEILAAMMERGRSVN
jgi:hypothetical protein